MLPCASRVGFPPGRDGARPCGAPSCSDTRDRRHSPAIRPRETDTFARTEPDRTKPVRLSPRLQDSAGGGGNLGGRSIREAELAESAGGVPKSIEDWDRKFAESDADWFFGREPSEMARLTANYWKIVRGDTPASI